MIVLAVTGAAVALLRWGASGALGFSAGAVAGWLNFRWMKGVADALGAPAGRSRGRTAVAILFGARYLLLGAGAYVIVRFTSLSLTAALVGLFVPVAAVILEILYELVYASAS